MDTNLNMIWQDHTIGFQMCPDRVSLGCKLTRPCVAKLLSFLEKMLVSFWRQKICISIHIKYHLSSIHTYIQMFLTTFLLVQILLGFQTMKGCITPAPPIGGVQLHTLVTNRGRFTMTLIWYDNNSYLHIFGIFGISNIAKIESSCP